MKYKVYNNDSRFGDSCAEYFDTLEEAEKGKDEYEDEMYDTWKEEVQEKALDQLLEEVQNAITIEEEEEEE